MSKKHELNSPDRLMAAEHALGVLGADERSNADNRMLRDMAFREEVESWEAHLAPMLDEVDEVSVPDHVQAALETRLFGDANEKPQTSTADDGIWKLLTAFASTIAVACLAFMFYVTGGDITGQKLKNIEQQLASLQQQKVSDERDLENARGEVSRLEGEIASLLEVAETTESELTQSGDALARAESELEGLKGELSQAESRLTEVLQKVSQSRPLVASLNSSGDAPAFVAQYDPVREALLIRSAVPDSDEKVPELWLIPNEGEQKGNALSMGVLDENAPNVLSIDTKLLPLIRDGGTLAITMEPEGGAPEGVATGPVIALGTLQSF